MGLRQVRNAPPASDMDLRVLLEAPLDYFKDHRTLVDQRYPLQLEATPWMSADKNSRIHQSAREAPRRGRIHLGVKLDKAVMLYRERDCSSLRRED